MIRHLFTFTLILLAALSRLLPHPPNVAPITAMALFGGVYLERKHAFLLPLAALVLSDYVIGFYSGMWWVYGSFLCIGLLGLWLRNHRGIAATAGVTIVGSLFFFVVTNFGVWASSQVSYPHTTGGLIACYAAAIPFFRNSLLGDAAYVAILFGAFELAKRAIPSLEPERTPVA